MRNLSEAEKYKYVKNKINNFVDKLQSDFTCEEYDKLHQDIEDCIDNITVNFYQVVLTSYLFKIVSETFEEKIHKKKKEKYLQNKNQKNKNQIVYNYDNSYPYESNNDSMQPINGSSDEIIHSGTFTIMSPPGCSDNFWSS